MFHVGLDHSTSHKEASMSRRRQDTDAEAKVLQKLRSFWVFAEELYDYLRNIATKDQATVEITESILSAGLNSTEQMQQFLRERLLSGDDRQGQVKFHTTMKRTNPVTFSSLYEVKKTDKQKISLKADRSVLQRLIISYEAGRTVDLDNILKHELMSVPLSLAETDGSLRTGQKSILTDEICTRVNCFDDYTVPENSTLVIDGQALVVALGKPQKHMCTTFGEFATVFVKAVFQYG